MSDYVRCMKNQGSAVSCDMTVGGPHTCDIAFTGSSQAINDNACACGAGLLVPVSGTPASGLSISIQDAYLSVSLTHTHIGDLVIEIVPPSGYGNRVAVFSQACGRRVNMANAKFYPSLSSSYASASVVDDVCADNLSGNLKSYVADWSPLFTGLTDLSGTNWRVFVGDCVQADIGTFTTFTLRLVYTVS